MWVKKQVKLRMNNWGFPSSSEGKESTCNGVDLGSIPGLGRSPGGGYGNPLHYSCLENPMDRGAWRAPVHGVAELDTTERQSTVALSGEFQAFILPPIVHPPTVHQPSIPPRFLHPFVPPFIHHQSVHPPSSHPSSTPLSTSHPPPATICPSLRPSSLYPCLHLFLHPPFIHHPPPPPFHLHLLLHHHPSLPPSTISVSLPPSTHPPSTHHSTSVSECPRHCAPSWVLERSRK